MINRKNQPGGGENVSLPSFVTLYPNIAAWVQDGWVEIGQDDHSESFVRALDIGGLVWEGEAQYSSLYGALHDLDAGIAAWFEKNG